MKKLTPERAAELRANGIVQIASVVKSVYNTEYCNVNSIDAIMANGGKWIPAARGSYPGKRGTWHGRVGIARNKIDWTITRWTYAI
jgi:hypothetical protein